MSLNIRILYDFIDQSNFYLFYYQSKLNIYLFFFTIGSQRYDERYLIAVI